MKLIEQKGDLFELDTKYALAHCISLDCTMGAGIAVEFDKRFKVMRVGLKNAISDYDFKCPVTLKWFTSNWDGIIFNLITKEKYWHKPTYNTLHQCVKQMAEDCRKKNVKYLAMPKIGCGLDRLQWSRVNQIIEEEFRSLDIEIVIKYL